VSRRQLNLFGDPRPARRTGLVEPAPVGEQIERIAVALPPGIRLGTSSWSFPGWNGLVYDRETTKARLARQGLASYARHPLFRTVGIDRTYYAPVPAETFAEYAAMVPDDFRFLVKASSELLTPQRRDRGGRNELYFNVAYAVDEVVGPFIEGLGEKAGPLLFQFPPQGESITKEPGCFADRLDEFLEGLPRGPLYAVELRDRELLGKTYFDTLGAFGAQHCLSVHPRMPSIARQATAVKRVDGPMVARWMLGNGLGYKQAVERYEPFDRLVDEDTTNRAALAGQCVEQLAAGRSVYVIANNKAEGSAPLTISKLAESIVRRLAG